MSNPFATKNALSSEFLIAISTLLHKCSLTASYDCIIKWPKDSRLLFFASLFSFVILGPMDDNVCDILQRKKKT